MESDQQPQIKGVVVITLPPSDNPSLGKTITAFTLTADDDYEYPTFPHQTLQEEVQPHQTQTHLEHHLPIRSLPPQSPETHFPLSRFFLGTPRKVLGLLCISLFAFYVYSCLLSSSVQELKGSDDDREPKSFIFPLYHKLGIREIPQKKDLQQKLGRLIYKENLVEPVDDAIVSHQISKLAYSNAAATDSSTILPVRGNVFPDGLYYTSVLVGSPPRTYFLDVDTGSDLAWIQCDAPCTSCAKGANSLYKPRRGHIISPKDSLCIEIQRNHKAEYCEACEQCDYEIEYADHSSSMGVLAKDELHLMIANGSRTNTKFIFGCAYDQQGMLLNTLAKTDGILGLSRAKASLPSQLANQDIINNVVGHCLATDIVNGGYMFLGDDFMPRWGMAWVPMLNSLSTQIYQTQMVKLNYGKSLLSLGGQDNRLGRIVFDSGSSYTYLPKEAYTGLIAALKEISGVGLVQDVSDTTLPICWRAKSPIRSIVDIKPFFKTLTIQFGSKWWIISTKFRIPPEGYLVISDKGNVCLGILDGSKVHDGSTIILGGNSLSVAPLSFYLVSFSEGTMHWSQLFMELFESVWPRILLP